MNVVSYKVEKKRRFVSVVSSCMNLSLKVRGSQAREDARRALPAFADPLYFHSTFLTKYVYMIEAFH